MAKDKQKKKKEREKRVHQKKLAEAARRRAQEKADGETGKKTAKTFSVAPGSAVSKSQNTSGNQAPTFIPRRTGG